MFSPHGLRDIVNSDLSPNFDDHLSPTRRLSTRPVRLQETAMTGPARLDLETLERIQRLAAYAEWAYYNDNGSQFRYHAKDLRGLPYAARNIQDRGPIFWKLIKWNTHVHLGIQTDIIQGVNVLVLAFRGTDFPLDLESGGQGKRWLGLIGNALTDVSCGSRRIEWNEADRDDTTALRYALVHEGFLIAFDRLRQNLYQNIMTLMEGQEPVHIEVCGHSLGGALATLCALWCTLRWPDANITCVTIGSPRVGDERFAEEFGRHKSKIQCYRIMTDSDPIPTLPDRYTEAIPFQVSTTWPYIKFKWDTTKYRHVGRAIWLHKQHERPFLDRNPPHIDHEEQASNLPRIADLGLRLGGIYPYACLRVLWLFWNIRAHIPTRYSTTIQNIIEMVELGEEDALRPMPTN
ncbi:hypothetical protein V2G26_007344 [Clonostachys chloroleuca]